MCIGQTALPPQLQFLDTLHRKLCQKGLSEAPCLFIFTVVSTVVTKMEKTLTLPDTVLSCHNSKGAKEALSLAQFIGTVIAVSTECEQGL